MIITQGGCGHDRDKEPTDMNVSWNPRAERMTFPWTIHPHRTQAIVESMLGCVDIPVSASGVRIDEILFEDNILTLAVVIEPRDGDFFVAQKLRLTLSVTDDS